MPNKILNKSIGIKLKQERLNRGLTLDKIASETKISKSFIESIEEEDFSEFESHTQAKGFISIYAKYLGIDPTQLLALYKRDYQEYHKSKSKKSSLNKFTNFNLTRSKIVIFVSLFVVIIAVGILATILQRAFQAPFLKINFPVEVEGNDSKTYETSDSTLIIKGETDPNTLIKINEEPIPLHTGFIFESNKYPITSDKNIFIISATNQVGVQTVIRLEVTNQKNSTKTFDNMDATVKIKNDPTFVLVRGDGIIKFNDQLYPEDGVPIKANRTLDIESSTPQNIILTINDQEFVLTKTAEHFELVDNKVVQR